jgi:hypothetical protein
MVPAGSSATVTFEKPSPSTLRFCTDSVAFPDSANDRIEIRRQDRQSKIFLLGKSRQI